MVARVRLKQEIPEIRFPSRRWYWQPERVSRLALPLLGLGTAAMGLSLYGQILFDLLYEHNTASLEDAAGFFTGAMMFGFGLALRRFGLAPAQFRSWMDGVAEAREVVKLAVQDGANSRTLDGATQPLFFHTEAQFRAEAERHFQDAWEGGSLDSAQYLMRYAEEWVGTRILFEVERTLIGRQKALAALEIPTQMNLQRTLLAERLRNAISACALSFSEEGREMLVDVIGQLRRFHLSLAMERHIDAHVSSPRLPRDHESIKIAPFWPAWVQAVRWPFDAVGRHPWISSVLGLSIFSLTLLTEQVADFFRFTWLTPGLAYSLVPGGCALASWLMILPHVFRPRKTMAPEKGGHFERTWLPWLEEIRNSILDALVAIQERGEPEVSLLLGETALLVSGAHEFWRAEQRSLYAAGKYRDLREQARNLIYQREKLKFCWDLLESAAQTPAALTLQRRIFLRKYVREDPRLWRELQADIAAWQRGKDEG